MKKPLFLGSPREIRRVLLDRVGDREELKLAVAFVTTEWMRVLADFDGSGRLICWLTSGATDPEAVKRLMQPGSGFEVRHLHAMHAKVYLCSGLKGFAIVGSANLSSPALAGNDHAGNTEAAVLLESPPAVAQIDAWFESLWRKSREVRASDLARAKKARVIAKKAMQDQVQASREADVPSLSPDWSPPARLRLLAAKVRNFDLRDQVPDLSGLIPSAMTHGDVDAVVDYLVSWARRRGTFTPVKSVDIRIVRRSFRTAFDESLSVNERLSLLRGSHKLPGIGLPAWTMILYYWSPEKYPPYNVKTAKFGNDFKLGHSPTGLTPRGYAAWLELCGELSALLKLPSIGHVDRLVWLHSEGIGAPPR